MSPSTTWYSLSVLRCTFDSRTAAKPAEIRCSRCQTGFPLARKEIFRAHADELPAQKSPLMSEKCIWKFASIFFCGEDLLQSTICSKRKLFASVSSTALGNRPAVFGQRHVLCPCRTQSKATSAKAASLLCSFCGRCNWFQAASVNDTPSVQANEHHVSILHATLRSSIVGSVHRRWGIHGRNRVFGRRRGRGQRYR